MAAFCTKCGATLPSTTGFCPSCGARIEGSAAPPPAASMAGYPAAAPPKNSSPVLKIVLIVIAVVVALGVLGAGALGFMAWRVSKAIHASADGNGATVSVPGVGTVRAGNSTATEAELGVPVYPGAVEKAGGVNVDSPTASMVSAQFSTNDPVSQVVDFYKSKLGDKTVAVSTGDGTVLNSGESDSDRVMVTVGPSSGDSGGKTTFVVMHTKKK